MAKALRVLYAGSIGERRHAVRHEQAYPQWQEPPDQRARTAAQPADDPVRPDIAAAAGAVPAAAAVAAPAAALSHPAGSTAMAPNTAAAGSATAAADRTAAGPATAAAPDGGVPDAEARAAAAWFGPVSGAPVSVARVRVTIPPPTPDMPDDGWQTATKAAPDPEPRPAVPTVARRQDTAAPSPDHRPSVPTVARWQDIVAPSPDPEPSPAPHSPDMEEPGPGPLRVEFGTLDDWARRLEEQQANWSRDWKTQWESHEQQRAEMQRRLQAQFKALLRRMQNGSDPAEPS